jgi:molybdopterin molybdotransferase
MISFDDAQALLVEFVKPLGTEYLPLEDCRRRVLAEDVHALVASPRRDVSAMDGYALRDADAEVGAHFRVVGKSFAGGELPPEIGSGDAVRIFTGASLPKGANRVVMQENCRADGSAMVIAAPFGPGWHVRKAGSDFGKGDLLLAKGHLLDPQAMVTLAAADRHSARVYKPARVTIIATGDELVPPGMAQDQPLSIPESVSFGVSALAEDYGADVRGTCRGADDLPSLERQARESLKGSDVIIVTGGASVGERDFAKAMFASSGLELLFAKVAIKPGKPVWLGMAEGKWVIGLPGNPTSAMVTARLFLAPLLALLHGRQADEVLQWKPHLLSTGLPASGDRLTFMRADETAGRITPICNQDSGAQAALRLARFLIRRDAGETELAAGEQVQVLAF